MAADQPSAPGSRGVHAAFAHPEHGLGIGEGIADVEVEAGVDDNEIIEQDVVGEGKQQIAVTPWDFADAFHFEAAQGGQTAIGNPEFHGLQAFIGSQAHLLVISLYALDVETQILQLQEIIQHPFAVRPAVDHVSQKVEFVRALKPDYLRNKSPEGAATAVYVGYYEAAIHRC